MNIRDELTIKERLQLANMLQQGEVGHDGRYGDWRNIESRKGMKLALLAVTSGVIMACAFFSLLVLGGVV